MVEEPISVVVVSCETTVGQKKKYQEEGNDEFSHWTSRQKSHMIDQSSLFQEVNEESIEIDYERQVQILNQQKTKKQRGES